MKPTVYALFVGINDYLGYVPHLQGCVQDVKNIHEFLQERTQAGGFAYAPQIFTSGDLKNQQESKPKRKEIIAAFREHLCQAGPGDIALFYFSGHGSQEKAPPEFWHMEPDRKNETIVLYDSRIPGGWDLADKELALLIAGVACKKPHILIILDSCHSGSGTRAPDGVRIRMAPMAERERPLDTYLEGSVPPADARPDPASGEEDAVLRSSGWFTLPEGRHVVLSACHSEESAREKMMEDGKVHGLLSYYLIDALRQSGPGLSYRDVFNYIKTRVRNTVNDQNPLLAATDMADLRTTFLEGAVPGRNTAYFMVDYHKDSGWLLDAGEIHGIARTGNRQVGEATVLSLFPFHSAAQVGSSLDGEIGVARVIETGAAESRVEVILQDGEQAEKPPYKAFISSIPIPAVSFHLSGDDSPSLEKLRQELRKSPFLYEEEEESSADIVVSAVLQDDCYRMRRAAELRPLQVVIPHKGSASSLIMARARLEHIAQWMQVLRLENKGSSIPPNAVEVEFFVFRGRGPAVSERIDDPTRILLTYADSASDRAAHLQIRLINRWAKRLYVSMVDLSEDFAITSDAAFFGDGTWLDPGEEHDAWAAKANGEKFIDFWVPDEVLALGITQVEDTLKLIIGTDETRASYLHQDGLEQVQDPQTRGQKTGRKEVPHPSTLDRLMRRMQARSGGSREQGEKLSDFRTLQFSVTTKCLKERKEEHQ